MIPRTALEQACERYGIQSPLERAHFYAQCAHESRGFTRLVENLNYRADLLLETWPTRFTPKTAAEFAHRPVAIANKVYANRMGNGNEASGDGWKYRGRGYLQVTGKDNYKQTSRALFSDDRLLEQPFMLEADQHAADAAGQFWQSRHLSVYALKDDLVGVTRGVNGGTNGLEDRRQWLARFKQELGVQR